jgi:hypothetical protein
MSGHAFLENSVIVAAHADDEVLWFNAIVKDVDQVIVVFEDFWAHPGIGAARRAALADYPRAGVSCLAIPESGAYGCAQWDAPQVSELGIEFGMEAGRRAVTRLARKSLSRIASLDNVASESVATSYRANYRAIYEALRERLSPGMNVFTHNPWGEYGHEEHVQVFRALDRLRSEIGFTLWMSNYCTERSLPLAMRYFHAAPGSYLRMPTDKAFADEVAAVYKRHGCWTWADDWAWFEEECYMEAPREHAPPRAHAHLFPLNFFTIDGARGRSWLPVAVGMSAASAAISVAIAEAI